MDGDGRRLLSAAETVRGGQPDSPALQLSSKEAEVMATAHLPENEVARLLGVHRSTVRVRRRKLLARGVLTSTGSADRPKGWLPPGSSVRAAARMSAAQAAHSLAAELGGPGLLGRKADTYVLASVDVATVSAGDAVTVTHCATRKLVNVRSDLEAVGGGGDHLTALQLEAQSNLLEAVASLGATLVAASERVAEMIADPETSLSAKDLLTLAEAHNRSVEAAATMSGRRASTAPVVIGGPSVGAALAFATDDDAARSLKLFHENSKLLSGAVEVSIAAPDSADGAGGAVEVVEGDTGV